MGWQWRLIQRSTSLYVYWPLEWFSCAIRWCGFCSQNHSTPSKSHRTPALSTTPAILLPQQYSDTSSLVKSWCLDDALGWYWFVSDVLYFIKTHPAHLLLHIPSPPPRTRNYHKGNRPNCTKTQIYFPYFTGRFIYFPDNNGILFIYPYAPKPSMIAFQLETESLHLI